MRPCSKKWCKIHWLTVTFLGAKYECISSKPLHDGGGGGGGGASTVVMVTELKPIALENQIIYTDCTSPLLSECFDALLCTVSGWTSHQEIFIFRLCLYSAIVVENSRMVEKNLPLSNLMACLPRTAADGREQNKERLSTGTKFALRQWLKFLYPPRPGNLQRGDSFETVFHMLTKTGHQPMKAPFWGKWSRRLE